MRRKGYLNPALKKLFMNIGERPCLHSFRQAGPDNPSPSDWLQPGGQFNPDEKSGQAARNNII
jgi:hypothetical protein